MSVDYSKLAEAVNICDVIEDDIYTESTKGRFSVCYSDCTSFLPQGSDSDFFGEDSSIVQDYVDAYLTNNGFDCSFHPHPHRACLDIGWSRGDKGESKHYYDIAMRAVNMRHDFTKLMLREIGKAAIAKSGKWEVSLSYDFINRQSDTAFWLASETKRYCDEHDDFFDCEVVERYHELALIFTNSEE